MAVGMRISGLLARRPRWLFLLLSSVLVLPVSSAAAAPAVERVVLVTIDTLRADHLPCYGYPRPTAPFLCLLAERGVRFENAFSAASLTAPSHASILTSLFPYQHGVLLNGAKLGSKSNTMARMFAAAGFRTAGFASVQFLRELGGDFGFFRAFRSDERVSKHALRWLRKRHPRERFFLWVHFFDVHGWHGRPRHRRKMEKVRVETKLSNEALLEYLQRSQGLELEPFAKRRLKPLTGVDRYDGRIRFVDDQVKRLYTAIGRRFEGRGLWVVTADHGEGLGAHGYLAHGKAIHQEQLRVPLILHLSDGSYGKRVVRRLVRHVDLLPTIAELAGVALPEVSRPIEGRSLAPLLEGRPRDYPVEFSFAQRQPVPVGSEWANAAYSLHSLSSKYIASPRGDEFYDLEKDPLERRGRSSAPSREGERLQERLRERIRKAGDSGLVERAREIDPEHEAELRALGYLD